MNRQSFDFGRWWLENSGRGNKAPRYTFQENEIVSTPYPRNVSSFFNATYLNLHPTHYAVAIGPDGRIMNLRGGYNVLPPGNYTIHYVDKQNRVNHLPRTGETTYDGAQVALELAITYRVIDPIKALEVQNAVDTLIRFIQSDVKEFIRSHKYDEIMGDLEGHKLEDEKLVRYIKDQHAGRHQLSKLFFIADVVIKEKIGDTRVIEIREKYQINQREFAATSEMQRQNQELRKALTEKEALIQQAQAEAEVKQQDILQKMKRQQIELDNARQEFKARQEILSRAMDAIGQALSSQSYPQDPQVAKAMRDLLGAIVASPTQAPDLSKQGDRAAERSNGSSNYENIDSLTNNLLHLIERKRF